MRRRPVRSDGPARPARATTDDVRLHYVVEVALRAQFGDRFRSFGAMRRQGNELEYPTGPGETTTPGEAVNAITNAEHLLRAAQQLLPTLSIF